MSTSTDNMISGGLAVVQAENRLSIQTLATTLGDINMDSVQTTEIHSNLNTSVVEDAGLSKTASAVLDIVQSYGLHSEDSTDSVRSEWSGRSMFEPYVLYWIRKQSPVQLVLPAFPFKSSNPDKVLGHLPDFGEFLGLARLHALCAAIRVVYKYGAQVTIATDGTLFYDLFCIDMQYAWDYAQTLKAMIVENSFQDCIKIVNAAEILGFVSEGSLTPSSFKPAYKKFLDILVTDYCDSPSVIKKLIDTDADTKRTYTQISKFLERDLANTEVFELRVSIRDYKKQLRARAASAMARSEGFGKIIRRAFPHHLRMSIHASSGAVKLSFPLIPPINQSFPSAPWMCCIAVGVDGKYHTVGANTVKDTHDLVYRDGRPWCYRERSSLFAWANDNVELVHVFPQGLQIRLRVRGSQKCYLRKDDAGKLIELATLQPVFVKGFANIPDGLFRL